MPHANYTLRLATGELVTGPIQGSGGTLGACQHERLQIQIDRANAGDELGIYEPKAGHASMHVVAERDNPDLRKRRRAIDLRGAVLVREEHCPGCQRAAHASETDDYGYHPGCR